MRILVESMKRLYLSKKITKNDIELRFKNALLTEEEYNYIIML